MMRQTPTNLSTVAELRTPSTRERILEGASAVFERLGYEATRVEDILQAAGVSRPTFYRVFRNKDEVYAEITDAEIPKQRSARERVLEGAREAFGRLGYELTRVEDILEASGVSRPTFYRVFASKQDTFEALDLIAVQYLSRALEQLLSASEPKDEHFELVLTSYFEWRVGLGVYLTGEGDIGEPPGLRQLRKEALQRELAGDASALPSFALASAIDALAGSFATAPSAEQVLLRRERALQLVSRLLKKS
jgi:AcrR family transcriptional regulator